jgi:hypothetical protein
MNWESNKLNAYGSMAYFGEAQGGPPGNPAQNQAPGSLGEWFKDPKNLAIIGMGALALILLIMLVRNKD